MAENMTWGAPLLQVLRVAFSFGLSLHRAFLDPPQEVTAHLPTTSPWVLEKPAYSHKGATGLCVSILPGAWCWACISKACSGTACSWTIFFRNFYLKNKIFLYPQLLNFYVLQINISINHCVPCIAFAAAVWKPCYALALLGSSGPFLR